MNTVEISNVYSLLDPPLWLVTSAHGGRRGGFIATTVTRASIVAEMPRQLITVNKRHHTHTLIEASGAFGMHLNPATILAGRVTDFYRRSSGNGTACPPTALRATASVNSMYRTPVAKFVNSTTLFPRMASMKSASTRQPPCFSVGIGISCSSPSPRRAPSNRSS